MQFKVYSKGHWLYFEVHFLLLSFLAFIEKCMNYSVAKRVNGELRDSALISKWSKTFDLVKAINLRKSSRVRKP